MNKQSTREIFDNISLNVISFLENHIGINDVEFIERSGKYIGNQLPRIWLGHIFVRISQKFFFMHTGVTEMSIAKWEEENTPFQLPEDYKAFLQISDGLSLTWKIKRND